MRDPKRGAGSDAIAWKLLVVVGILNLVRGAIHVFADDGGAERIAGFDISAAREIVLMLFAVMGLHQIAQGIVDLLVGLRWRAFAVPLLWFHALFQTAAVATLTFWRPIPGRPPGEVGAPLLLAILWAALAWIHWRRRHAPALHRGATAERMA